MSNVEYKVTRGKCAYRKHRAARWSIRRVRHPSSGRIRGRNNFGRQGRSKRRKTSCSKVESPEPSAAFSSLILRSVTDPQAVVCEVKTGDFVHEQSVLHGILPKACGFFVILD